MKTDLHTASHRSQRLAGVAILTPLGLVLSLGSTYGGGDLGYDSDAQEDEVEETLASCLSACPEPGTTERCRTACTSDGICATGECHTVTLDCPECDQCEADCNERLGEAEPQADAVAPQGSCVEIGADGRCENSSECCGDAICVDFGDAGAWCTAPCEVDSHCASDCCVPLESGGGACAAAGYCA